MFRYKRILTEWELLALKERAFKYSFDFRSYESFLSQFIFEAEEGGN